LKDHYIHRLSNGLTLVYHPAPDTAVTHIGYTVYAGSRDDAMHPGTAHCFEHMLFKGTQKRKAWHIINRLENVGGEMNAFTTKEITVIYASVMNRFADRATELLSDLMFHSTFPEKELIREKKVISEEINMYLDTPEENIYDELQEMVFEAHSLAPNILGDMESLEGISSEILRAFHAQYYNPENMALSISSALPFEKFIRWAEKLSPSDSKRFTETDRASFNLYAPKKEEKKMDHIQCHAILGNICYAYDSPSKYPMLLLNNLLGGPGMNSRLNLSVREKYGYTYNVESGYTAFSDTGLFHLYLSTERKNLEKAVHVAVREMNKLMQDRITPHQLKQAQQQYCGQLLISEENRLQLMLMMGKCIAQGQKIETTEEVINKIQAVSAENLRDTAMEIFDPSGVSYLAYVSD